MALKSAPGLLKAIEGFAGETAGSKEHEGINETLRRVTEEIHKGSAPPQDSPGRREAKAAGAQREMDAEPGHDGGDGNATSNRKGPAAEVADRPPDMHGKDGRSDKLSDAAPPLSRVQAISAKPSPFPSSPNEIRRLAANKEASRPDSKYSSLEGKGDGNEKSVKPGPPAGNEKRIGDVRAPAPDQGDDQKEAERASASSSTQPEPRPPFAQQQLKGDEWKEASNKAKKVLAGWK
jgi:hypothetical protein